MSTETAAPTWVRLEVWLGPMEGLTLCLQAAVSRTIRIGRLPADRASGTANDLVLSRGVGVSAVHAELRIEAGRLVLRDLGSTNGTFALQQRVTGELSLPPGEVFLVSFTPVRVSLTADAVTGSSALSRGEPAAGDEAAMADLLAAAKQAAESRKESYVDSRHLCEAVLKFRSPWMKDILKQAGWSRTEALMELWSGALFKRNLGWAAEVLNRPLEIKGLGEVLWAPKVLGWLEAARRRAPSSGYEPETALRAELLELMLHDREGAVGGWLNARGVKVPRPESTGVHAGPALAVVPPPPASEPGLSEEVRALVELVGRLEQMLGAATGSAAEAPGFARLVGTGKHIPAAVLADALSREERFLRAVVDAQHEAPRLLLQRLWPRSGTAAFSPENVRDQLREIARELVRQSLGKAPARKTMP